MHEMAITQGIVELCLRHAGGRRVMSVEVEVGDLGGVVPEALEFCFDACSRDTLLEGAALNIIRIPGGGHCRECGTYSALATLYDACRHCGSHQVTIENGEELRVRSIDIED